MSINIHIEKKDLWLIAAIMVFLVGVAYVIAYNSGGPPSIMGHSAEEIEGGEIYSDQRSGYIELISDASWADLAVVNLPADFSGGTAYIHFTAPIAKDGAFRVRLTLDGSSLTTTPAIDLDAGQDYLPGAIRGAPVSLSAVAGITPGAHTIKAQWIGFESGSLPNLGAAYYAIIETGSVRVLTVITGQ